MAHPLESAALDQLFLRARSHNLWLDREVPDTLLQQLYHALRQGPTSNNCCPARFVFVRSPEAKQKLLPALKGHNGDKMLQAPVTVIVAWDSRFFELLPELFPIYDAGAAYRDDPQAAFTAALRNSSLQGAYLIMAARALGLDCGPMSGFDNARVDAAFFPDGRLRSNFLCCLGYGDDTGLRPAGPRLSFEQGCRIL
ncbi:malonic semialdehyde reductase [Metapseudomonas resinovorans]|uniref:Putative NADH dehydrogenase/NAD(P)H nitroreductase PCA10_25680 n=1 Tax=Metapseudomonas resinovorans NBRC 106553 TaxID=1245471 RepID=S6AIQ0_METRE|nr:malonic semialdehyde reductase [Pseudomonas resinovorans]BAN48300.1 putative NADH dehydrogenase/NAD(P)H nitroreductase [Pseudomonas resinovorans NBRC 106553]